MLTVLGFLLALVPLPRMDFVAEARAVTVALPRAEPVAPEELAEVQAAADEPLGEDRVEATAEDVEEFSLMAVVFDAAPVAPVMVRVQDAGGGFEEWRELHVDLEEGPDVPTNFGTEPFWVGDGRGYEVNLSAEDAAHARVVLVRTELRRTVTAAEPVAGAATPPFGVGSRASWGARAVGPMSYGSTVKLGVVHHSESSNDYSQSQVPSILRSIQAYHMDGRGWSDIAYNFVVDKYGGLWEGRAGGIDRPVIGAHAMGFNTNSVGVMVIGSYTSVQPSGAAVESVSKVIGWKMALHGSDPSGSVSFTSGGSPKYAAGVTVTLPRVVGHGDVGATSCPGSISGHLPAIRQRAQEWTNWVRAITGPTGVLDQLSVSGSSVNAFGWVTDLDAPGPTSVRLDVGGVTAVDVADSPRPDVQAVYPSYPLATGFQVTASGVPPQLRQACVTAVNQGYGSDTSLGCSRLRIPDVAGTSPDGRITRSTGSVGALYVSGWAREHDAPVPSEVELTLDGVALGKAPTRPDGSFELSRNRIVAGRREVCLVIRNRGNGYDVTADCVTVDVAGASPIGNVDGFALNGRTATISGWAWDPEASGPVGVMISYDGGAKGWPAASGLPRPDVQSFIGVGGDGGFRLDVPAIPDGRHSLCAYAINVGGGSDQLLGCRDFVVK